MIKSFWSFIRTLSGDNAYEEYLKSPKTWHKGKLLSRGEFYQKKLMKNGIKLIDAVNF